MKRSTKSIGSFSWALSLFGLEQLADLLGIGQSPERPPDGGDRTLSFDRITRVIVEHLSPAFRSIFQTGEELFHRSIDALFGPSWDDQLDAVWSTAEADLTPGSRTEVAPAAPAPVTQARPTATPAAATDNSGGWGPMPPIPEIAEPGPPAGGAR